MSLTPESLVPTFFLLVALVLHLMEETIASHSSSSSSSLMEVLHNHGLPGGLFPQNVKSYTLDPQTGRMEVHMDSPCLAQYETKVLFDTMIKVKLSFRQLKVLEGMKRKELFLWLPVRGIRVFDPSSGLIVIDIGLAFKRLALSRFEDPPICKSYQGHLSLSNGGRNETGLEDQR